MFKSMKKFAHDDAGVTAIEYAQIASLIAVFIIAGVNTLGADIQATFEKIGATLAAGG